MENLPSEIIVHITTFLEVRDIVHLQSLSKRFLTLGRDGALWKEKCFWNSTFLDNLRRRQELSGKNPSPESHVSDLIRDLGINDSVGPDPAQLGNIQQSVKRATYQRTRMIANWDPSYPRETVDWYDEYIARKAPISTSWFQQPRRAGASNEYLEVRGMGLYTSPGDQQATRVVAPLDDGSICLWDLSGPRKGAIVARSKPGMLEIGGRNDGERSKMISTGITECVSIDSAQKRLYVAVQDELIEIDLETLSTVSRERYPFSITALSAASHPVPLTVGLNFALYLHDSRSQRVGGITRADVETLDNFDVKYGSQSYNAQERPELYAHLHQPGPLSILHLPSSSNNASNDGNIYVAGRFPSILNYDRRYFPRLRGTIHSGASLCSLVSLPYPFASPERDLARKGELSLEQVREVKSRPGNTLIACGEYKSKGSLELFGLCSGSTTETNGLGESAMKNRQTSSSSKLLSVANHGTRIVVSDGSGSLKWFERDGFTEVRRWNLAHGSVEAPRGIFGSSGDSFMDSGSGDIAIKILTTNSGLSDAPMSKGDLMLWTGEKLGMLTFTNRSGFTADSFESVVEDCDGEKERAQSIMMRRALQAQADDVRFVRGLGRWY